VLWCSDDSRKWSGLNSDLSLQALLFLAVGSGLTSIKLDQKCDHTSTLHFEELAVSRLPKPPCVTITLPVIGS
jgi:hypothetical protein